jgi:transcriptional regulator with XRE-family HTH domain
MVSPNYYFSQRLRELRKRRKLTLADLGARVGIDKTTIATMEAGKSAPSFPVFLKLADAFGVTLDYLAGRDVIVAPEPPDWLRPHLLFLAGLFQPGQDAILHMIKALRDAVPAPSLPRPTHRSRPMSASELENALALEPEYEDTPEETP